MPTDSTKPPTIDPVAAARWARLASPSSPWLHEHVGAQMEQRLQWIRLMPGSWIDWNPTRGGREAHAAVARRYPLAHAFQMHPGAVLAAAPPVAGSWWGRLLGRETSATRPPPNGVDMIWANMLLHHCAEPLALMREWHSALAVNGFLMFSCLGPDSLCELRDLYVRLGWPAPTHDLTDMHDWGDLMLEAGFAEPVMDMTRLTLSYSDPQRLLSELRGLGRNLYKRRFPALRGRGWRTSLIQAIDHHLPREPGSGRLTVSFEVIFGHAFKPLQRIPLASQAEVSLEQMRAALKRGRDGTSGR